MDFEAILQATEAFGLVGFLVYMLYESRQNAKLNKESHNQQIKYYRTLAFSLLTVAFIALIEDENKAKAIIESMNKPSEQARES